MLHPAKEWIRNLFHVVFLHLWSLSARALGLIHPPPPSPPLPIVSAAQACNEDVLLEIFKQADEADLANAALVCHTWLPPARQRLYYTLHLDTSSPTVKLLRNTLTNCAHLRGFMRRLEVVFYDDADPTLVDWIALLPEHSLHVATSDILHLGASDRIPFLEFPAIRTVPHLSLRDPGWLTKGRLIQVFSFNQLKSLSIYLYPTEGGGPLTLSNHCLPNLRRLSITVYEYFSYATEVLNKVAGPLERFDLYGYGMEPEEFAVFREDIRRHLPNLTSMSFTFAYPTEVPFVDELAPLFTMLETLACGSGTYTPDIIPLLPHTLRSIVLYSGRLPLAINECASIVRQGNFSRALSRLTVAYDRLYLKSLSCESLIEACKERGIVVDLINKEELHFMHMIKPYIRTRYNVGKLQ